MDTDTQTLDIGLDGLLYQAWAIIANASDWRTDTEQSQTWVQAAEQWRDKWHHYLALDRANQ